MTTKQEILYHVASLLANDAYVNGGLVNALQVACDSVQRRVDSQAKHEEYAKELISAACVKEGDFVLGNWREVVDGIHTLWKLRGSKYYAGYEWVPSVYATLERNGMVERETSDSWNGSLPSRTIRFTTLGRTTAETIWGVR